MKIGIVGSQGWVGKQVNNLFSKYNPILYDEPLGIGTRKDINSCYAVFVCVPTPQSQDNSCDTSIVEEVVSWIQADVIIIRSTIPPGSTDKLCEKYKKNIVMNPEYIGETVDHPLLNTKTRTFLILGGKKEATQKAVRVYQMVYNASIHIMQCSAKEAEVIKYCENSFIGTYVTFCNEFYNICENVGVDWNVVREGFLLDPRMPRHWTFVYPDHRGFDGKCIPKDMNAIVASTRQNGYDPKFLDAVLSNNDRIRGNTHTTAPVVQETKKSDRVDIDTRYVADEEIRKVKSDDCPYLAYYNCVKYTFDLSSIDSICDVGCATGHLIANVKQNYPHVDVSGVEYFAYHKESRHCSPLIRNDIVICDFRDPWVGDKKYDIVNCSEFAEHIDKEYAGVMMENLKKMTKKYLVMTWSSHGDGHENEHDPHHQHLNPLPYDEYVKYVESFGFRKNDALTQRFMLRANQELHFFFWWKESLVVWELV